MQEGPFMLWRVPVELVVEPMSLEEARRRHQSGEESVVHFIPDDDPNVRIPVHIVDLDEDTWFVGEADNHE
jgi:hypothetical protein